MRNFKPKYSKKNKLLFDPLNYVKNSSFNLQAKREEEKIKELKPSIIVYLQLKGKWGTIQEESNDIQEKFNIREDKAIKIVEECKKKGYIETTGYYFVDHLDSVHVKTRQTGYSYSQFKIFTGRGGYDLFQKVFWNKVDN